MSKTYTQTELENSSESGKKQVSSRINRNRKSILSLNSRAEAGENTPKRECKSERWEISCLDSMFISGLEMDRVCSAGVKWAGGLCWAVSSCPWAAGFPVCCLTGLPNHSVESIIVIICIEFWQAVVLWTALVGPNTSQNTDPVKVTTYSPRHVSTKFKFAHLQYVLCRLHIYTVRLIWELRSI